MTPKTNHHNSATFVSDRLEKEREIKQWFAVHVRSRHEKIVHHSLEMKGVKNYLPLTTTVRQWADRKKKVSLPLFKGYVFVHIALQDSIEVLEINGVVRLVSFNDGPVPIPDEQIETVRRMLDNNYDVDTVPHIQEGQPVEIIGGPLIGLKGVLLRKGTDFYFAVTVDMINRSVIVKLNPHLLRPM